MILAALEIGTFLLIIYGEHASNQSQSRSSLYLVRFAVLAGVLFRLYIISKSYYNDIQDARCAERQRRFHRMMDSNAAYILLYS
jgi:hypothetical protein